MNTQEHMIRTPEDLCIPRRLIPIVLAVVLFLLFISFALGYFCGVKYTTEQCIVPIQQETLAQQLMVSGVTKNSLSVPDNDSLPENTRIPHEKIITHEGGSFENAALSAPEECLLNENNALPIHYSAELIGFGTKSAAEEFIKRVATYEAATLELKERQSKTPRGRMIHWYQVITSKYEQKKDLQNLLDTLIKKEHLHDIKIVAYAPSAKELA